MHIVDRNMSMMGKVVSIFWIPNWSGDILME